MPRRSSATPAAVTDSIERGVYVQLQTDDTVAPVTMHAVTPRLQGTPGAIRRAAPVLGQHNDELRAELGAGPSPGHRPVREPAR